MNPFDLLGPEFLLFYVLAVLGFGGLGLLVRRVLERGDPPSMPEVDPYLIACLRRREAEAVALVALTLVDRKLLQIGDDARLSAIEGATARVRRPIERAILEDCRASPSTIKELLHSDGPRASVAALSRQLERLGLVPNEAERNARLMIGVLAVAPLWMLAAMRISSGVSAHHPVGFLVVLTVATPFAIAWMVGCALLSYVIAPFGMWRHQRAQIESSSRPDEK